MPTFPKVGNGHYNVMNATNSIAMLHLSGLARGKQKLDWTRIADKSYLTTKISISI
jgi:hypothetical protein